MDRQPWADQDLEPVAGCPVCHTPSNKPRHAHLHDRIEHVEGVWTLLQCGACACLYLNPRPTRQTIGRAYASYYTHSSGAESHAADNGTGLFWKLANGYMNLRYGSARRPALHRAGWLIRCIPPLRQQLDFFYRELPRAPGQLLDVGSGNGAFLLRARAAGWDAIGLEPDATAAGRAAEAGLEVINATLEEFDARSRFDQVTASHVIEHVHDPRAFLQRIAGILKPGGRLWLATPNASSPGHRWYGRAWRGLEPPRHLTIFSARALRRILSDAGYTSIRFRRRGRGAHYILRESRRLAHNGTMKLLLPVWLVDLAASLWPAAGEELVVTARRPLS